MGPDFNGPCRTPDGAPARDHRGQGGRGPRARHERRQAAKAIPGVYILAQAAAAYVTRLDASAAGISRTSTSEISGNPTSISGPDRPIARLADRDLWDYIAWARRQPIMIRGHRGKPMRPSGRFRYELDHQSIFGGFALQSWP